MFQSARLQLTIYYVLIILFLSIIFTVSIRTLADRELVRSNRDQRGDIRTLMEGYGFIRPINRLEELQLAQEAAFREQLNDYVLLINMLVLVFGTGLSYWFAGRTLRPIEDALNAQRRFAADASHELRTPLTVMRTENEVFLRSKKFNELEAKQLISSNLEEVDRLDRLASSLLALAQYEEQKLPLMPISTTDLFNDLQAVTEKNYPEARVTIAAKEATIQGDRQSLGQLLRIIVDNAVKYGPADPKITISGKKRDKRYVITVRDNGPGINKADLPFIFDRFYRGDKSRSKTVEGHGLGLALARTIATANQAQISATNSRQGGAAFSISLII